jgi:hypothetical protein
MACSDLLASHHKSVIVHHEHGNMEVFQSLKGDEITTHGYKVLTSTESTSVIIAVCWQSLSQTE